MKNDKPDQVDLLRVPNLTLSTMVKILLSGLIVSEYIYAIRATRRKCLLIAKMLTNCREK